MNIKRNLFRIFLVVLGAVLMALNINSFVYTAELLPGGFTGVAILIQEVFDKILGIKIPFSPFYWALNMIPAVFCFKYVGKKLGSYYNKAYSSGKTGKDGHCSKKDLSKSSKKFIRTHR